MIDLIIGMASGYEWREPGPPYDWKIGPSGQPMQQEHICFCGQQYCTTHICSATGQFKDICPCGGKGCGKTIEPFVISLRQSGYTGRCVMITGNGSVGTNKLAEYGVETYDLGNFDEHPYLIRPLIVAKIIEAAGNGIRYVLAVDARDIVFQSNPMSWIEQHIGDYELVVTTEGGTYGGETEINKENARRLICTFGLEEYERLKDRPICNGGVIAGIPSAVRELRLALYKGCAQFPDGTPGYGDRTEGWPSEQIMLDHVLNSEAFIHRTLIVEPKEGLAFSHDHIHHGATVQDGVAYPPKSSTPYSIFHQYLEWRDSVWTKYVEQPYKERNTMKILMTGTSGYIGTRLLPLVIQQYPQASILTCDVKLGQDYSKLEGYEFDLVFHLGAISTIMDSFERADEMMATNALNLIPFFENNKVEKFIFSSTGAIYGNRTTPVREEEAKWTGCISPYAQSKYVAEGIIRRMCPNHIIARFGNVFGGNTNPRGEMLAITHFMNDNPIVLHGGGQTRDFVHVDVVCKALIQAGSSDVTGTFNIANGQPVILRELAEMFSQERGVPIVYKEHRHGDVVYVVLDVTKAREAGLLPKEPSVNDYHS